MMEKEKRENKSATEKRTVKYFCGQVCSTAWSWIKPQVPVVEHNTLTPMCQRTAGFYELTLRISKCKTRKATVCL